MIAGMDEAGRGPAIGPLVFGLVVVTPEQEKILEEKGVNDSKTLSAAKRQEFKIIIEETVEYHDVLVLHAPELDQMMKNTKLNEIEVIKFRKLLEPVASQVTQLQLDAADVNAERFGSRFTDLVKDVDSRHKGDSIFRSVGAASILAKVARDECIENLQKEMTELDPELPSFGSGYPTQAKPFLEAYVEKYKCLPEIARHSWQTSKNALETHGPKQSTLDDFF